MAYVGTPIDTTNQFQSLQGKRFSGDGSTTAFTLDIAPTSVFDIEVFVENVRQDPNSAYTLNGTTLTFAAAPASGTNSIYVIHQAKAVGTINAPIGGTIDMNGVELVLDEDGDTSITADTDDQIDFRVGGSDKYTMTSDTFTARNNVTALSSTTTANVRVQNSTTGSNSNDGLLIQATGNDVYINNYENADMYFRTNNSDRLKITSGGKILVNTTTADNGMINSKGADTTGDNACYGLERGSNKGTIGLSSTGDLTIKAANGEVRVEDSGGNSTVVSPHNFSVIPDGESEELAWSYYSRKGDEENDFNNSKYISTDITKVIRKLENLTGEKFIYKGIGSTDDGSTVSQNIIQSLTDRVETLETEMTALKARVTTLER